MVVVTTVVVAMIVVMAKSSAENLHTTSLVQNKRINRESQRWYFEPEFIKVKTGVAVVHVEAVA